MRITTIIKELARLHMDAASAIEIGHRDSTADLSMDTRIAMIRCPALAPLVTSVFARSRLPWEREAVSRCPLTSDADLRLLSHDAHHMVAYPALAELRRRGAGSDRLTAGSVRAPRPQGAALHARAWLTTDSPADAYAIYAAYCSWAQQHDYHPVGMDELTTALSDLVGDVDAL